MEIFGEGNKYIPEVIYMKLKEILINEMNRDDDWRTDDSLQDSWDDHYHIFYEEIQGMVEELSDMYPENPSAKKAQKYFMDKFQGMDQARVHEEDYSEKFIHYVLGTDFRTEEIPFKVAFKRLKEFEKWLDDLERKEQVYHEWKDIESREHGNETFEYGKKPDAYADRGLKRSNF